MSDMTFRYRSASATVHKVHPTLARVTSVYSSVRRQGHATGVLQMITAWADRKDVTLLIVAQAYGKGDIPDNPSLIEFYKKNGFVEHQFQDPWPRQMVRHPSRNLQGS